VKHRVLKNRRLLRGVVWALYQAARLTRRARPRARVGRPRRVVHVAPSYFSDRSSIGGGERYAMSLAEALADHVETAFVSFGPAREHYRRKRLRVEVYPAIDLLGGLPYDPLAYNFVHELTRADVVHCHQFRTAVSNLAVLAARALGKRVFVTDLGAYGCHFTDAFPLADFVDASLPLSAFGAALMPFFKRVHIIRGGVDERFTEGSAASERERLVLFVGRLLPHKGINYLIEAVGSDIRLDVVGRAYHAEYFKLLGRLAAGKQVRFVTDASDAELLRAYRRAQVTVLPSVYMDVYGTRWDWPELLGLVLLESMACGTPVICTEVGGMPEFVEDGVTGFVVPPNDPAALRERVSYLLRNPAAAVAMGQRGKERVLKEFTWDVVARRCLAAYAAC
jgi:glycosyltransferase involved in cell wall biosynthesis